MGYYLNKEKALNNFLEVFRRERTKKFIELDVEFMKALETSDTSTQTSIATIKNTLRDFPTTLTNDSFSSIDELRSLWPTNELDLPDSW
jgi:hypothetical protein